ncbi:TetR/AcrR family transcriptional regulator [Vibrio sp.]|uniref:TetR/AcrR family transcriptional regulator n=1 Tax=Vibrio viridaestus TaxID=2487322 RepID=A0A3N9TAZ6_9VIBR|nr:TetR/AcrR family transcriptional regulator [Vibrio viridaestus]MDC0610035.1 TetR/AcrR family transcriptional regulator [Vibrio sp.]RQW61367.1 TetR/AcrR family transcriptional regulator [Vibrio viridaestus]
MSKKEHILDIAERLFNQFGYTAVGVDLIRDEAEVSKTSMYRHFGSKNKLIEAVLDRRHLRFEYSLEKSIDAADSTEDKLDALLEWHFQWFQQDDFKGCMFMHAVAEFKQSDQQITDISIQHKQWLKSLLNSVIANNKEQPKNQPLKVEMAFTFLEGMIIRSEFEHNAALFSEYRKTMHEILLAH